MDFDKYLLREYDLILIIDVFEHFTKEDGVKIIEKLRENTCNLLISIPRYVTVQKGYSDDTSKFEEHRAFWTRKMFKELGSCIIIPNNARKTIALYSKDAKSKKEIRNFLKKKLTSKFLPYIVNDFYNYVKWILNRNNSELFLKKER